jgi:hypothetical protein
VITIIGLAPAELERTLRGLTGADRSLPAKARELADAIVVQFVFTPTGERRARSRRRPSAGPISEPPRWTGGP